MTWAVPTWYALALLALAAYRLWRLLAYDTILDPLRRRKLGTGKPDDVMNGWLEFLQCPYCLGAHAALAWWLFWVWQAHWTLVVATPFAISAVVALIAVNLDPD